MIARMAESFRAHKLISRPGSDGEKHALYPGATHTLCDQPVPSPTVGRPGRPTCKACLDAAALFNSIDRSAPAAWALPAAQVVE